MYCKGSHERLRPAANSQRYKRCKIVCRMARNLTRYCPRFLKRYDIVACRLTRTSWTSCCSSSRTILQCRLETLSPKQFILMVKAGFFLLFLLPFLSSSSCKEEIHKRWKYFKLIRREREQGLKRRWATERERETVSCEGNVGCVNLVPVWQSSTKSASAPSQRRAYS